MLPTPEKAVFLIADITGYSRFLAATEIAHAQDIVSDFLNTVTNSLVPDLSVAKYEGDAAFLYAPGPPRDPSHLEDLVEGAYIAFRRRQRDVRQASACTCAACMRMGDLDFKFVVHAGEMVRQQIGDREELAGRDVIQIHRLLKNGVGKTFGPAAYAIYSAACFGAGTDPALRGLLPHVETDDALGSIDVWYRDLAAVWSAEADRRTRFVSPEESYRTWEFTLPGAPRDVWERITVPGLWQEWWFAEDITEVSGGGRRGTGTQNHCAHGENVTIEQTLDWHPFDYYTCGITLPVPGAPQIVMTRRVTAAPGGGTLLAMYTAPPAPEDVAFFEHAAAGFDAALCPAIERLRAVMGK